MQNVIHTIYHSFLESSGVFTDTRKPLENGIYFSLSGPNFNGNKFATQAIASGALKAIIDDPEYESDNTILVEDSLKALQLLANHHRNQFKGPVFALTGSNGKTTTKELISAVLETRYKIISTRGNFNNHIGVPLTLLRITRETELAVIEMGANHVGEIAKLCTIADPSHGMITNIGKAHLEGFGSYEGILRGKSELFDHLRKNDGQVFINSADPVLKNMGKRFSHPLYFPGQDDFYHCELAKAAPYIRIRTGKARIVDTHLIGEYNFSNAAAALCIGKYFEVPEESAEKAISEYKPQMNRSEVLQKGSNTIILDAYNANPDSMKAALQNLSQMESENKVVILGDMFELGEKEEEEHQILGKQVATLQPKKAIFCGKLVSHAASQVPDALHFREKEELADYLTKTSFTDSVILLKASRGMGLESLIDLF